MSILLHSRLRNIILHMSCESHQKNSCGTILCSNRYKDQHACIRKIYRFRRDFSVSHHRRFLGSDLMELGKSIKLFTPNFQTCCERCVHHETCKGFTFIAHHHRCVLKDSGLTAVNYTTRLDGTAVSGIRTGSLRTEL